MSVEQKHTVFVVPGLGDTHQRRAVFERVTAPWALHSLAPQVYPINWGNGECFTEKLSKFDDVIDHKLQEGHRVSLVGTSAAGPLVISALVEQPSVHRVATVSSRLKGTPYKNYPTLLTLEDLNEAAADGVRWLEKNDNDLTPEMRRRILNTRVIEGDNQVPPPTSFIEGANNVCLPPARNHIDAVTKTFIEHGNVIIDFLSSP